MKKYFIAVLLYIISMPTSAGSIDLKSKESYEKDSQQICYQKWNKRGELNSRMYKHCMEGQMDGYKELKYLHQYANQSFYSETAFPYCRDKWTKRGISDTRMMAHCLNQEIEGIKDVMYYREQYGEDTVNRIVARALVQFGSWNMAAYKVKRYFE
ncbi:hypothetical protein [Hydrogenovibrio thermophilus]|uniref:DUF1311 domain-containing protein n=1 Tax=Hydrogenovibrio thermophilus TaxID=265883 RepID=A0A451G446_9GAMM|nr:hypothetical protein [Hydrogenovibrio thermophilus]QAB14230.1 hypothetical protein EPV75_00360 [Hydrogenovibrio thermophilus]